MAAGCETEKTLKRIGAFRGKCPWTSQCVKNLDGDRCELARTCEAMDTSKQLEIKTTSLSPAQN